MKLILVRHGRTVDNEKRIMQGQMQGKLSEAGKEQAKKVALRLKREKIDFIYSSNLKRASDTAKEIAKYHPDAPIEFVKELRERHWGSLQGKSKDSIDWNNIPDDVEPLSGLVKRVKLFLDKVYEKHSESTVLFVSHGRLLKALLCIIFNKPFDTLNKPLSDDSTGIGKIDNASVTIFEIDEDKNHKIHVLNCVKHLE
ncbi:MAG: histidine phosphatase family protein [Nanoarchaeota archaeon]